MVYMEKKIIEKPLNGDIPAALFDAFAMAVDDSGLKKKRAVAAAAYAFIEADNATRTAWWQAGRDYDTNPDGPSATAGLEPQTDLGRKAAGKLAARRRKKGDVG